MNDSLESLREKPIHSRGILGTVAILGLLGHNGTTEWARLAKFWLVDRFLIPLAHRLDADDVDLTPSSRHRAIVPCHTGANVHKVAKSNLRSFVRPTQLPNMDFHHGRVVTYLFPANRCHQNVLSGPYH